MSKISSTLVQQKAPSTTLCSRLFHAEHDIVDREDGKLVCSIYSMQQHLNERQKPRKNVGIQRFGVIWGSSKIDDRVFQCIEEAIVQKVIAPVQLICYAKGTLTLVLNPEYSLSSTSKFASTWVTIASHAIWDEWTVGFLNERDINHLTEGRVLRTYASAILLAQPLGITDYCFDDFLYKDSWCEQPYQGDPGDADKDPDDFDGDLPF